MNSDQIYLSVVIPAYNEEERIGHTLGEVASYLSEKPYSWEIIVVNDGSTDRTVEVVSGLCGEVPGLRIIDYGRNRGKGWAVREGMLAARGSLRLFMDADNSTTVDHVERMLPLFEGGADIVIGSRRVEGACIAVHQSWLRENTGRLFNLAVRCLNGLPMEDTQAGFKAFSEKAAEAIFPLQTIWHWPFDVELLTIAERLGFTVREVPIEWRNDPHSSVSYWDIFKVLYDLVRVRLNAWSGAYDP